MLADPIRPATPPSVASVANSIHSVKLEDTKVFSPGFSPPLTTSSRSSVALEHSTPPLPKSGPLVITMANGNAETTVGTHCLQQLQIQSAAAAAAAAASGGGTDLNGYPGPSQLSSFMHEIPARNTTSVASLLPPGAHEYHLNGSGDEEKTVKAVLTAPLTKAKRMRDAKGDLVDKTAKRPRANARPPAPLGSANSTNSSSTTSSGTAVGKSASMQRLMNLVQPVVSEVVTDFQRDRVAERRAAVAQTLPSTSNGAPEVTTPPLQNGSTTEQPTTATINGTTPPPPPTLSNGAPTTSNQRLNLPSFMEQLLERQWDQGSSLLMANAHFDVAQLLSCLFQLKSENVRLEDNLATLRKRRDYLFALNTRLSEVNCIDVVKQREPVVPKQEIHKPEPTVLPANHSSQLFEDVKPPAKQTKKATVVTTPATPVVQQNHRTTTPSTTAVAPPITPANLTAAVSAANDIAASLSPDRMPNGAATQAALIRLYGSMSHMDPAVAAQFSMMSNFPGGVNQAIFSRLLATAQPAAAMANIASMMNGGMPTAASVATSSPSSTTIPSIPTPNGK
uniref:HSF_DOMAIN domain-containing protein n=1 Tax=Caenorhabditis tropicalis TaxID=1561998 RepID=A0A1I7UUY0_9PELO